MENLNAENLINEIQSLIKALKDCGGWVKRGDCEGWFNHEILADALALITSQERRIKELGEDNEYLKTQLTATEARYESRKESDIAEMLELRLNVEELTEENERLRAENARYEAENHAQFDKWLKLEEATKRHHSELFEEAKIAVKEETVRKMQESVRKKVKKTDWLNGRAVYVEIDKIAKEMLDGEK